jgi:CheY-specific phosphatase CheX
MNESRLMRAANQWLLHWPALIQVNSNPHNLEFDMSAYVTEESICTANAQFWEQMLAMPMQPVTEFQPSAARCIGAQHVVGSCDLSGVWSGRIEVRLSRGLALQATSAMLMQPAESVLPDDTLDATREIANMIAGTIKSALPRPCSMTVPFAELETGDFCILPRTSDSVTVFFRHDAGELMVRVWEGASSAASANMPLA